MENDKIYERDYYELMKSMEFEDRFYIYFIQSK